MTNADKFESIFGLYATELWAKPEKDFLEWLNADVELFGNSEQLEKDHFADPGNMVGDTISRQAAIEALEQIFDRCEEIEAHLPEGDPDRTGYKMYPDYLTVWSYLHQLPSAQSDLIAMIQNGINATSANNSYSCGMRNGMRWCMSLIDDKEPLFENCPSAQPECKRGCMPMYADVSDCISRQAALDEKNVVHMELFGQDFPVVSVATLKGLPPVHQWISCSERLPKVREWVLCQCRAGIMDVLRLTEDNGWYKDSTHTYMHSFVLAWCPLPEPWKGDAL